VFKRVAMADHERNSAVLFSDMDMAKAKPGIRFKPRDEPDSLPSLSRKVLYFSWLWNH
jgi:hypothetical protein